MGRGGEGQRTTACGVDWARSDDDDHRQQKAADPCLRALIRCKKMGYLNDLISITCGKKLGN